MQHNYNDLLQTIGLLATSYIHHLEQLAIDSGYSSQEACDYTVHNLIAALREDATSSPDFQSETLVSLLLTEGMIPHSLPPVGRGLVQGSQEACDGPQVRPCNTAFLGYESTYNGPNKV